MSRATPAFLPRAIAPALAAALDDFPVVVLTGLRQCGKTTLLRDDPHLGDRTYVTLDDLGQLEAARRDPEGFIRNEGALTIDEAQRCPELLLAIKASVDRDRRPGRFILSGSAQMGLANGVSESLAGRAAYLSLHPFSLRERSGHLSEPVFLRSLFEGASPASGGAETPISAEEVLRGGMPPVSLGRVKDPAAWFRAYEQTYLERDVRDLARIGDLVPFRNLLRLTALRTGQVLNVSDLARDAKLSTTTAARYLSILEASFVVRRQPPFLQNRSSRLLKSAKIYVEDSGLAASLAGVDDIGPRSDESLRGPLYETFSAQNLAALLAAHWPRAALTFWNIQGRHEVDFVIEVGRDTLAVEIKAASRFDDRSLAGLRAFLGSTPRCRAGVLAYNGGQVVKIEDRLWAVPLRRALM
jgi:predicted AAA+ superfamily ATPase